MGKAINMLNMLILLRTRGMVQAKELAEELGVQPRMIRRYKNDFEQLDIYIESKTGKYGGYYISTDNSMLDIGINRDELVILNDIENYLEHENFIFLKEYQKVVNKVESSLNIRNNVVESNFIFGSVPNVNSQEEKEKYLKLEEARVGLRKVEISYFSLTSGLNIRIVQPYRVYLYQGFWYLIAYCELRNEIRQFKLSRVKELKILDEEFAANQDFYLEDYLTGCVGIVCDKKKFTVRLKIDFPMSIKISERIWVEGQEIIFNEDNSIIFEAEMTGLEDISNWILSMGGSVEVLEPIELRTKVKKEAKKIFEKN